MAVTTTIDTIVYTISIVSIAVAVTKISFKQRKKNYYLQKIKC